MVAPWTAIQEQRYIRFVWQIRSSAGSILDEAFNIFAFYDGRIEWSYKSFNWVMMSPVDHIGPYPVETTRLSAAFAIVVQTYIFLRGSE